MGINRKVINATPVTYDGITFRSKVEMRVYIALCNAGYMPEYEPDRIVLMESFRPKRVWYYEGIPQHLKKSEKMKMQDAKTYTPDFKIAIGDTIIYLEAKGHPNDSYSLTRKMFLKWLDTQEGNIIFSEVRTKRGLNAFIEIMDRIRNAEKDKTEEC